MPAQLDLFLSPRRVVENISHAPAARANDVDTSKAAGEPNHGTDRWTALRVLRDAGLKGMTDFELGDAMERQQTSAGKRRLELQRAGYVRDSGMRRPAPSGSMAIVWVVG